MNARALATRASRVLIVDDYADARSNIRDALEELGYQVFDASNGLEALHFLVSRANPGVELIVLDLAMPIMDGWQLLDLLDGYVGLRHIPVLIVSAHLSPLGETKHQHVVGFVQAPYEMRALTSKIEALLAH